MRWNSSGSSIEVIDRQRIEQVKDVLAELGSGFSDVFGPDGIIFVEGPTEVECFRAILDAETLQLSRGVSLLPLIHTDRVSGKNKKEAFAIYEQMVSSIHLIPPALAYCRDKESFSSTEIQDAVRASNGRMKFLPRRSYENYLLHPRAIAALLSSFNVPTDESTVREFLIASSNNEAFSSEISPQGTTKGDDWEKNADSARILKAAIGHFTGNRFEYRKLEHGVWLTRYLLEHDKDHLAELIKFVSSLAEMNRSDVQ